MNTSQVSKNMFENMVSIGLIVFKFISSIQITDINFNIIFRLIDYDNYII